MNPITPAQLKAIHTLRRKRMDEDCYRDMLAARFGATSTKDLDRMQAKRLLDEWMRAERKPQVQRPRGTITRSQWAMLTDILAQCGMRGRNAARWARRYKDDIRESLWELEREQASRAIAAARIMYREFFGVDHEPGKPKLNRKEH